MGGSRGGLGHNPRLCNPNLSFIHVLNIVVFEIETESFILKNGNKINYLKKLNFSFKQQLMQIGRCRTTLKTCLLL